MDKTKIILIIAAGLVLVVGAGSFYGGMRYQAGKSPAASFQRNGSFGMAGQGGAGGGANRIRNNGGFVAGEIIKKDDKSITIQLGGNNGVNGGNAGGGANASGSKTVYYSDTTTVSKSVPGAKDDLAVGANVMITGTTNADGSIIAQIVQIRPDAATETPGR